MKSATRRGSAHSRAGTTPAAPSPEQAQVPVRASSSLNELRDEYRRLFHTEVPKLSRDLLVRAIGYRRQEIDHGGLGNATRRKLQTIAKALRSTGRVGPTPSLTLKPGARLVREWHGRTHTVTVTDQREACAAFIQSQKHEGWTVLPALYDDGGYSGGTMERPALTRLIADIEAGKVDVVVVYKVDRLTRALSDFAKLVDIFDLHSVSFVSITQQFNTTTSMGRLTLNVLLSFAQFEREVIAELTDQGALLDAVRTKTVQDVSKLIERGRKIADSLQSSQTTTIKTTLMTLLTRAEVGPSRIDIRVSRAGLADLLAGKTPDLTKPRGGEAKSAAHVFTLKVPARLKRSAAKCGCWSRTRMTEPPRIGAC